MGQQSQESASLWYYATLNSVSFFLFHSSPHTHIHSWLGNEYISHIIILLSPSLSLSCTHTLPAPVNQYIIFLVESVSSPHLLDEGLWSISTVQTGALYQSTEFKRWVAWWVLGCIYLSFHFMSKPQPHLTLNLMWSLIIAQVFLKFSPCGVAFRSSVC